MAYQPIPTKNEDSASASGDAGVPMLAIRQLADTTSSDTDGDYTLLKIDEEGRLKVASKTASFPLCQGVLTTTAAVATGTVGDVATAAGYLSVDVSRASNVVLHVKNTGGTNQTAGNFTFEASIDSTTGTDGTWFAVQAIRSNANTIELTTGTLTLNAGIGLGYSYEASVNAYKWFRVRVNVNVTTGAADTWSVIRGSYATEPIPGAQVSGTQAVSGTVTATVTAGTVNPVVPATPYFVNSAATTNGALVLTGTSGLQAFYATNEGASYAYVKLYNKATAPTVGTDVPEMIIPIPPAATGVPGTYNLHMGFHGFRFALGLGIAITGAAVYTDTTAVAAGQVKVKLSRTV